jgi:rRNA-processing protein FCF1
MPPTLFVLPKSPLIDTNVLYEFLLWRFSEAAKIPLPESASNYLSSDDLRTAFNWYVEKAKPIYTSPQVIAEIHGLVQSRAEWYGQRLADFWGFAQRELARLRLEERLVQVKEMKREDLKEFGPIDSSILELAKRTGGVVVTEEGDLNGRLRREQIGILRCSDILALWQEWNA